MIILIECTDRHVIWYGNENKVLFMKFRYRLRLLPQTCTSYVLRNNFSKMKKKKMEKKNVIEILETWTAERVFRRSTKYQS